MLHNTIKMPILTDSAILFNDLIWNWNRTEKRLVIDINDAWEPYNYGIIDDIIWIHRKFNLADAMTKPMILLELVQPLKEIKLH